MTPDSIRVGSFYTNRTEIMVREVLEFVTLNDQKDSNCVKYRVVKTRSGRKIGCSYAVGFVGVCTVDLFAKWSRLDVTPLWRGKS